MSTLKQLPLDGLRHLQNLQGAYVYWRDLKTEFDKLNSSHYLWRKRKEKKYLYQIFKTGEEIYIGSENELNLNLVKNHEQKEKDLKQQVDDALVNAAHYSRQLQALHYGFIDPKAAKFLRVLDQHGLIGNNLMVVGSPCLAVYLSMAGVYPYKQLDATADIDFTWLKEGPDLLPILNKVANLKKHEFKHYKAIGVQGFEIDVLAAPSVKNMVKNQTLKPSILPEQQWLLIGKPVDLVVVAADGSACRMVVPDPRYFALQKLWMGQSEHRNPLKRPKDTRQGQLVLDILEHCPMEEYPLDNVFYKGLPNELKPFIPEPSVKPVLIKWD